MSYKNYIFDLYGTLIDIHTDEEDPMLWEYAARYLYEEFNVKYTENGLKEAYKKLCAEEEEDLRAANPDIKYPEIRLPKVFAKLIEGDYNSVGVIEKRTPAPDRIEGISPKMQALCTYFREMSRDKLEVYKGVFEMMDALKNAGKKIYLLSNAQRCFTVKELEDTHLTDYFDDIFISSDKYVKKPDPVFMELLLNKHGLKKEECLMIGNDIKSDVGVAQAAGVKSLFINTYALSAAQVKKEIKALGIADESLSPIVIRGWKLKEILKAMEL